MDVERRKKDWKVVKWENQVWGEISFRNSDGGFEWNTADIGYENLKFRVGRLGTRLKCLEGRNLVIRLQAIRLPDSCKVQTLWHIPISNEIQVNLGT